MSLTSSTWSGSKGRPTTEPDLEFGSLSSVSDASAGSGPRGSGPEIVIFFLQWSPALALCVF